MIKNVKVNDFFQQFGTDWLEGYGSVISYSMRITSLKDGNNTGDLPGIRDSASDERQIKNSAEDVANGSRSVFQHTTSYLVNPSSRIVVELLDESKNIRARTGKTRKSRNQVVLRDWSIGGIIMVETLSEKLTKGVGYVSGRANTNAFVVDRVRNGYMT